MKRTLVARQYSQLSADRRFRRSHPRHRRYEVSVSVHQWIRSSRRVVSIVTLTASDRRAGAVYRDSSYTAVTLPQVTGRTTRVSTYLLTVVCLALASAIICKTIRGRGRSATLPDFWTALRVSLAYETWADDYSVLLYLLGRLRIYLRHI